MNSVEPPRAGVVRAGGRSLRIAPWPADQHTAQLTLVPGDPGPTRATLRAALEEIADAGYAAVVTAALGPSECVAFADAGFEPLAWLHLLDRDLRDLAIPASNGAELLRRVRRSDWPVVAALDARAFPPFWHLGLAGIADARRATPSNRVRVALTSGGDIGGYAVFGRSGNRGFLQRLAVDPQAQGRGLGTALVLDGLRWMRARGASHALVNTQVDNERALALYRRLGFRLQDERLAVLGRAIGGVA